MTYAGFSYRYFDIRVAVQPAGIDMVVKVWGIRSLTVPCSFEFYEAFDEATK